MGASRGINAISMSSAYPLLLIRDLLGVVSKGKIFTKKDQRDTYFRVSIKEGHEWKTAFNTLLSQSEYLVMPFGLQRAPGVFINLINEVLQD